MSKIKLQATDGNGGTISLKGPTTTDGNAEFELTLPANDGSSGQYLKTDGSGALSWATPSGGISDVVSDTSPQLGGDLDTNSFEIGLDDSHKVKFGDDNDLEIWHTGSAGTIKNITGNLSITNTGNNTIVNSDNITFQSGDQGETIARFLDDGACELWHDNTKQCETSANGLAFPSGKGIDFSADGNVGGMTSELLDDYEEGTWTPSYSDGSSYIDTGSSNFQYIKIGNLVHLWGNIRTDGSATGVANFYAQSLPFSSKNSVSYAPIGSLSGDNGWSEDLSDSNLICQMSHNSTNLKFYKNSGDTVGSITLNNIGPNANILFSINYRSA